MVEQVVVRARIEIGPSPASFVDGLLGRGTQGTITLILEGRNTVTVNLSQIQREDGSGKKFNFRGYNASTGKDVCGYYNAGCGKGHIEYLS
ncbi:hypothetical protein A3H22_03245 [Candidatus Peribacteria bacterium RIFCSPLOWO2_12_FULL_55_15]|nr:MAG: hypothetical protein A2789_03450 [Candidatus Peribacteria bacterium RIFCSPHIGHO2_01_FULL_54_22]OGJ63061.1 MAG: hypothetical protein A3D12_00770 [Candidatus Peribacteria bacterium RIFCSPHIGHO2_02_FULL_55_24]OGJ71430.1 MAG: hypothetical protein A3H22_03245 [Candidatus Peribacteria bacterium RIFCSPLOWO2_12_FULL_55_15]